MVSHVGGGGGRQGGRGNEMAGRAAAGVIVCMYVPTFISTFMSLVGDIIRSFHGSGTQLGSTKIMKLAASKHKTDKRKNSNRKTLDWAPKRGEYIGRPLFFWHDHSLSCNRQFNPTYCYVCSALLLVSLR
jgi:hypothetical protein